MTTKAKLQAVILAAGKGTRMKSARAKVLHPVQGVPLLEHVVRTVQTLHPDPLTVVVGHQAEAVEQAFASRGLEFVRQDPPLGTGHALMAARERYSAHPDRTLVVVNGDVPLLRRETLVALVDTHRRAGAAATLLTAVLDDPDAYGRVLRDADGVRAVVARDPSVETRVLEIRRHLRLPVAPFAPSRRCLRPQPQG